jgi:hypothetical protein
MAVRTPPRASHRLRSGFVMVVMVGASTATAFFVWESRHSATSVVASTPVVAGLTHERTPNPGAIPPIVSGTIAGTGPMTVRAVNSGPAEECAGFSDALGVHGGPSPHRAGISDALGEHGGPAPQMC